jgi:hypothetical protein
MKVFNQFASHPFGSGIINVLSVIAGILLFKVLVNRLNDSGITGAFKAAVNAV